MAAEAPPVLSWEHPQLLTDGFPLFPAQHRSRPEAIREQPYKGKDGRSRGFIQQQSANTRQDVGANEPLPHVHKHGANLPTSRVNAGHGADDCIFISTPLFSALV